MTRGWSPERQAFVQYYGARLARRVQPADAARQVHGADRPAHALAPSSAIEDELVSDSLVYRYDPTTPRRRPRRRARARSALHVLAGRGLTRAGRLDEARLVFEKMLTYANHLGLFAEQIGHTGEALGNFPQAFTHLALITAAWDLNLALGDDSASASAGHINRAAGARRITCDGGHRLRRAGPPTARRSLTSRSASATRRASEAPVSARWSSMRPASRSGTSTRTLPRSRRDAAPAATPGSRRT